MVAEILSMLSRDASLPWLRLIGTVASVPITAIRPSCDRLGRPGGLPYWSGEAESGWNVTAISPALPNCTRSGWFNGARITPA
jgi:hypothetical protein